MHAAAVATDEPIARATTVKRRQNPARRIPPNIPIATVSAVTRTTKPASTVDPHRVRVAAQSMTLHHVLAAMSSSPTSPTNANCGLMARMRSAMRCCWAKISRLTD